jgi:hypothetical protein
MSTSIELATGELVSLAAGEADADGARLTQLQVYGRLLGPRGGLQGYVAVDVGVRMRPEELGRLAVELLRRMPRATAHHLVAELCRSGLEEEPPP